MAQAEKIPVAAVVGPTASGKSRLAAELALRLGGEVISADSMQIYEGMDIGTAKPTAAEMRGVPHHLIGTVPLTHPFSVADYVAEAAKVIAQIRARGSLPVLTGGTGLYVRSLLQNIAFTESDRDGALRAALGEKAAREGAQALVEELARFDPESARRIHPNNIPRVIRAIEIYRTTGVTMTEQLRRSREAPSPYRSCVIGLDFQDRQTLYDRINRRVDEMMENGLLAEAEKIFRQEGARTAAQAIGYKELFPYLRGEITLSEAVEKIKCETRHYAKRQLTWFRRDEEIHWLPADTLSFEQLADRAAAMISRELGQSPAPIE